MAKRVSFISHGKRVTFTSKKHKGKRKHKNPTWLRKYQFKKGHKK